MDRIDELEARLRRLEDERDIRQLVAAYGPLVDAGAATEVAGLWTRDGVYDVDEVYLEGHDQLAAMVLSKAHQSWIKAGCAHVVGPVHVTVDGDTAIAVGHSLMVVQDDGCFVIRRATANHWAFVRTPEGWRASRRTNRVLDGRAESPAVLAAGVHGVDVSSTG